MHAVSKMCRVLGVSPSGYYAWRGRERCARARGDEGLSRTIGAIHEASRGTYGVPRVHAELAARGCRVSRKRVARLMRQTGLAGVSRRRGTRTTRADASHHAAPDRVERQFAADAPDRLWVADITYVPTWAGFVYLAIVLDVFSRRVVGWAMAAHLRTELVVAALNMALGQRRPDAVVHHSDKGSQYTSLAFGKRCREMGVVTSTGSAGDCFDNAMAESFFATLECELIDRRAFRTQAEARMAIFEFIEGWYEIVLLGDTVNTTARIEQASRELARTFLVSAEALALINLPNGVESERMPPAALKGKSRQVQLYALDRTAFARDDERRQRTPMHA